MAIHKISWLLTRRYTWWFCNNAARAIFSSVRTVQLAGVTVLVMVVATLHYAGRHSFTLSPLSTSNTTHFPSLAQCPWIWNTTRRKREHVPVPIKPPWKHLLAHYSSAVASGENLYLWSCSPQRTRKFGNQLFNFAALFGVAWRNKRIPLWPSHDTYVSTAFRHRVVLDNALQINVRYVRLA